MAITMLRIVCGRCGNNEAKALVVHRPADQSMHLVFRLDPSSPLAATVDLSRVDRTWPPPQVACRTHGPLALTWEELHAAAAQATPTHPGWIRAPATC